MAIGTPVLLDTEASNSGGILNFTTGAAVPAGSRVFFVASHVQQHADYYENSFTDAAGLTWTRDFVFNATATDPNVSEVWSAPAPSGLASGATPDTVFVNGTGTIWGVIGVLFYVEGIATSSYTDGNATFKTVTGNPGNPNWTTNSHSTTNADDLLIVANFSDGTTSGVGNTITAPFTEIGDHFDAGNGWRLNVGYRIVSSTSSYSASGVHDNNPGFQQHQALVAYKAAAGGAPPDVPAGMYDPQTVAKAWF